jgi:DNA modification methylase
MGAGTTALVANRLGRFAVGTELNPDFAEIARARLGDSGFRMGIDFQIQVATESESGLGMATRPS